MRTHFCGLIDETLIGHTVTLAGWTDVARNLGGVCFIDLRDHEGIVQVTVDSRAIDQNNSELFKVASGLSYEDVLQVEGVVCARHAVNDKIKTGKVEVIATKIKILNKAAPLPFHAHENPGEDIRLKYRYLDLRRPEMQRMQRTRIKLVQALRRHLDMHGFQDIETPILTKATPEGARDFLVPARMHPGEFYALPQSPQLFKQILMVAGFDRYYQIARCFRDEALRADRQLEFTQLDMEFAFVSERDLQDFVEEMIRRVFKKVAGIELDTTFPRMTWTEAMRRFGSDKPDLRINLELIDVAALVADSTFTPFTDAVAHPKGRVAALRIPSGAVLSRKQIDEYAAYTAKYGATGLAYAKLAPTGEITSPIAKFFSEDAFAALLSHIGAEKGDIVFFGAGNYNKVSDFMGALRLKAGKDFALITADWRPLWVTDFPMFEWDEEAQRYVALHHPFTAPAAIDDIDELRAHARTALSRGYDMVLNGNEIGGGSIRIHRPEMQRAVFELLGITEDEARAKFGFLLDALNYGAPPHGGIAFGIDRIAALIAGTESIRDVIPFPKTTGAQCLMTDAPSSISEEQLSEIHVITKKPTP
ncbi:aspartyl-tRNA synthetase [Xylella fastidiosa 32]|uniref:aspartate--tRNA ligase n=1 Tax=Xylella fastidiosa TaxID=2371 RepID=UPI0003D3A28E|nr:aspartate--tRNA ligase [Xylella fastidiosa]ALQ96917.1 aspartate--tRNA ligase [Xylella fastidiosa]ETE32851.1 aspartyl-tRNA synthetase [Xylella fastidiosa 32]